jgi:hypothetical protein
MALYMVIDQFKSRDLKPVYARLREHGRMMPEGLNYVSSWIDVEGGRCYQVMETEDRALFDEWLSNWSDLFDFEIHEVITSAEASARWQAL